MVVFCGANHQKIQETSILLTSALQAPAGSLTLEAELTNDATKDGEIVVLKKLSAAVWYCQNVAVRSAGYFHEL